MSDADLVAMTFAREMSLAGRGSFRAIADFLLGEGTGVARLSMAEVALRSYSSKATLVRFAKRAGFAGWRDFRTAFLREAQRLEEEQARAANVDVNYPFPPGSGVGEVVSSVLRVRRLALDVVERSLDRLALEKAARALSDARERVVVATMQNRRLGDVFAHTMGLMGLPCWVPETEDAPASLRLLGPGDAVVAISYSGSLGRLPLSLVELLTGRGVTLVAVTNDRHGDLRELGGHVLGFPPLERYHDKMAGFYSVTCVSAILDLLFAECYSLRYAEGRSNQRKVVAMLGNSIPADPEIA